MESSLQGPPVSIVTMKAPSSIVGAVPEDHDHHALPSSKAMLDGKAFGNTTTDPLKQPGIPSQVNFRRPSTPTTESMGGNGGSGEETKHFSQTTKGNQGLSWAGVVQKKKELRKYEIQINISDGIGSVNVPEEIFEDASPLWENFLIGRFLAKAPHIAKVHAIVNKIWSLGDKSQTIDVFVVNSTTMKFRICDSGIRNRVMRRGMWNLAGVPVVVSKWSPFEEDVQPEMTFVPLWVHLKNVPMNMFSWKCLSFVSSPVGKPDKLHPETAQCIDFKVAKVFVKEDLTKELPKAMKFNIKGKDTMVQYSYPWLPAKCSLCKKWGHITKACLTKTAEENNSEAKQNKADEISVGNGVSTMVSDEVVAEEGGADMTGQEAVTVINEVVSVAEEAAHVVSEVNESSTKANQEKEAGWITPTKAGKSAEFKSKDLQFGQVSIFSNSRYSVLSNMGEEGEILEKEECEKTDVGIEKDLDESL